MRNKRGKKVNKEGTKVHGLAWSTSESGGDDKINVWSVSYST